MSGLYDEDGIDGPFNKAMDKAIRADRKARTTTTKKKETHMKKSEIVDAIVKEYDLTMEHLTEESHKLAQDIVAKQEEGKRVRTKTELLQALLLSIRSAASKPEEGETRYCITCNLDGVTTVLEKLEHKVKGGFECDDCAWGDTPTKKAKDKAKAEKAKRDEESAKERAKAEKEAKGKKKGGKGKGGSRQTFTDEGLKIVGKGLAIRLVYKDVEYKGKLLPTGEVDMNGQRWSSPFNAVRKGVGVYRNGWELFRYKDASGNEVPIDGLRVNSKGYADRRSTAGRSSAEKLASKIEKKEERIAKLKAQVKEQEEALKALKAEHKEAVKAEKAAAKAAKKKGAA